MRASRIYVGKDVVPKTGTLITHASDGSSGPSRVVPVARKEVDEAEMSIEEAVSRDPEVMGGELVFAGTRRGSGEREGGGPE